MYIAIYNTSQPYIYRCWYYVNNVLTSKLLTIDELNLL